MVQCGMPAASVYHFSREQGSRFSSCPPSMAGPAEILIYVDIISEGLDGAWLAASAFDGHVFGAASGGQKCPCRKARPQSYEASDTAEPTTDRTSADKPGHAWMATPKRPSLPRSGGACKQLLPIQRGPLSPRGPGSGYGHVRETGHDHAG